MTSTTILTVLLVLSFIVGRFLRRFETPHFVFSGMIYLIFGLLIGSHLGFGVLTEDLLYKLEPMTDLMTGIAGFLLGLRVPFLVENKKSFLSGVVHASLTFVAMVVVLFFVSPLGVHFSGDTLNLSFLTAWLQTQGVPESFLEKLTAINRRQLWFAFGAAATACSASLLSLGMISKFHKSQSAITRALGVFAPSGQLVAVVLLGFCLAMARADVSATTLNISLIQWLLATILSGLLCGTLFSMFIGKQSNDDRVLLAALGAIIFAAGIGTLLSVSSMFVCLVTGMTIGLSSQYADTLKRNLVKLEEPIFVLLLIMGGASWKPEVNSGWLLPAVYFLVRGGIFSQVAHRVHQRVGKEKLPRLGQGLLGQDLVAVAIALSLAKEFPHLAQLFLTTILGSVFLNDFVANSLLKKVILDNEQSVSVQPLEKDEAP